MPTQKGMSSFTGWKPEAGEFMKEKKDRERFSIKFNENDPAHEAVIRLLEKQGPHSKAQFIVNAVLHYVNCKEAPDISPAQAADKAPIEKIVMEVLSRKNGGQQDKGNAADFGKEIREEQLENTGEILRSSSLYVLFPKCGNEAVDDVLQMPVLCG